MEYNQPTKGSVFQKGGGSTNFEQAVQAAYLIGLFIGANAGFLLGDDGRV